MSNKDHFDSVWDALEDDPVRQENLKLRSALMMQIAEQIKDRGLTQNQAAEVLHITQPRVSALLQGKISNFRLDSLVDMAHRLGMHVSVLRILRMLGEREPLISRTFEPYTGNIPNKRKGPTSR